MSEEAEEASSPPVPAANEETPNDEESSPNDASAEQDTTAKAEEEVEAKEEEKEPTPNEEEAKPADPPSSSGEQLQQNKNGEDVPLTFPQRVSRTSLPAFDLVHKVKLVLTICSSLLISS